MDLRHTAAFAAAMLVLSTAAQAQQVSVPKASPTDAARQPVVDVSRLPVDIARIQRGLTRTREREVREGLNLRYMIDVFGQAPPIELFTKEDNLLNGPVPYGAPTHQDMINIATPKEFRAPAADFGALIRWLSDKDKKR